MAWSRLSIAYFFGGDVRVQGFVKVIRWCRSVGSARLVNSGTGQCWCALRIMQIRRRDSTTGSWTSVSSLPAKFCILIEYSFGLDVDDISNCTEWRSAMVRLVYVKYSFCVFSLRKKESQVFKFCDARQVRLIANPLVVQADWSKSFQTFLLPFWSLGEFFLAHAKLFTHCKVRSILSIR